MKQSTKMFQRIIAALAALATLTTLALTFTACANDQTPDPDDTTLPNTSDPATPETTSAFVDDDLPETLKINDTVTFLYWSDVERPEFFIEEDQNDGNIVNSRLIERNKKVEERLGVTLDWVGTKGNFNNQKGFVEAATNSVAAGGGYDIFAGYSMTAATLAMNGLTQNLLALDHIDFEKPWWPESLTDSATINGKLYFTSGDISTNMLYMMYATFFNKTLFVDHHSDMTVADLYAIANEGKWTIDKLIELCQGIYRDDNGNGLVDYGDFYGFETIDLHFDAFFIGSDIGSVIKNADGELAISPDYTGEKTANLLEKVTNFLHSSGYAYAKGTVSNQSSVQAFLAEQTIFTIDRVYIASGSLKDGSESFKYGLLPIPKYDLNQTEYKTCMAFPYTLYSVSVKARDADAAAAVLECMGSEGYRRVTPALFEQSMKIRYSESPDDSVMYDMIKRTVVMDLGRIFTTPLANNSYAPFRNAVKNNTASGWARNAKSIASVMNASIKKINEAMTGQ